MVEALAFREREKKKAHRGAAGPVPTQNHPNIRPDDAH